MIESQSHSTLQLPEEAPSAAAGDSTLARQVEEFRQEREDWELHRQQELERLRSEGQLLAEAWQRLEAEERNLLAERELLRRGAGNGPQSPLSPNAGPSLTRGVASPARETSHAAGDVHDHTAWLQFQQLRREIQRYGRRGT